MNSNLRKPPIAMTFDEMVTFLNIIRRQSESFYVLVLLACVHGLRVSEVINLRKEDFVSAGNGRLSLRVQRLKGSHETTQRLMTSDEPLLDVATVVPAFISRLRGNDLLFKNASGHPFWRTHVNKIWKRYAADAGLPLEKRHPHVAKHTCGILLRKSGASLETIQLRLGHKSLDSTSQYLRITEEESDAAAEQAFTARRKMAAVAGSD